MQEVDYIQKDKKNVSQNYNYASEAAIKEKLHAAFVKNGVWMSFSTKQVTVEPVVLEGKSGDRKTLQATVSCDWSLFDVESSESVSGTCYGIGHDSGDKAIYKAITGALKYMLTANFLIPTGDDAEDSEDDGNEVVKKPVAPVTQKAVEPVYTNEPIVDTLKDGDVCTHCAVGFMKLKNGSKGSFLGCSAYPNCKHTVSVK